MHGDSLYSKYGKILLWTDFWFKKDKWRIRIAGSNQQSLDHRFNALPTVLCPRIRGTGFNLAKYNQWTKIFKCRFIWVLNSNIRLYLWKQPNAYSLGLKGIVTCRWMLWKRHIILIRWILKHILQEEWKFHFHIPLELYRHGEHIKLDLHNCLLNTCYSGEKRLQQIRSIKKGSDANISPGPTGTYGIYVVDILVSHCAKYYILSMTLRGHTMPIKCNGASTYISNIQLNEGNLYLWFQMLLSLLCMFYRIVMPIFTNPALQLFQKKIQTT